MRDGDEGLVGWYEDWVKIGNRGEWVWGYGVGGMGMRGGVEWGSGVGGLGMSGRWGGMRGGLRWG